ncbi:hypothetical protein [Candidatus Halocynthiibacter alkanivorans]|uniref:hypothetical protein n=1 Tax=Candidatus Halocynthiibacter alkanivorans TaxID=2267619 RepID=UPI000DF456F5|nr:hypothetical protein [Candidatus Halocynthiibacter alkanivorans]
METVFIDGAVFQYIDLIRVALSEEDNTQRLQAIKNVKHDVVASRLELLLDEGDGDWMSAPKNTEFVAGMAKSAPARHEAIYEFMQTARRYEGENGHGNERKLNIAEHIGKSVWLSIREGKLQGVQVVGGILQQVSDAAREFGISGARDKDALRNIWKRYRGVVHLGMAMDLCGDDPKAGTGVLDLAERIRRDLSENCPRGKSKPYVDASEQICFVGKSRV